MTELSSYDLILAKVEKALDDAAAPTTVEESVLLAQSYLSLSYAVRGD